MRPPRRFKQIAATTFAVLLGIVAGVDIVGTPLAIVAINHASSASDHARYASDQAESFAKNLEAAVVASRLDDCKGQERLRELGRRRLRQKEHETPATLRLLHITPTPKLLAQVEAQYVEERRIVAPVNCKAYSEKALPK